MLNAAEVHSEFEAQFGRPCEALARAPGRVNLIGEHTDYNEGFVLPMALEQCTWVGAARRDDGRLRVVAADLGDKQDWPLGQWNPRAYPAWTSYVAGVVELLLRRLPSEGRRAAAGGSAVQFGADLLIRSDVPAGAGLSSSAALEVATALALGELAGAPPAGTELADLCRKAEHEFAGVPCGIMDQFVCVLGREGFAFLLDCRARTWEHIPLELKNHVVVVVDSGVKHALASGEYALRQRQCREAVEFFRSLDPSCRALRDVRSETVWAHINEMNAAVGRRALHVTTEIERTMAAAAALHRNDLGEVGRLIDASHSSLRDDFEASCREIELLLDIVRGLPGVLGARMTGGGFGGSIVGLIEHDGVPALQAAVCEKFERTGHGPSRLIVARPGGGAKVEEG